MTEKVHVPIKYHDKAKWGALSAFGPIHEICCEDYWIINTQYSFVGGHRVRLLKIKSNVHWKIPLGTQLDITDVQIQAPIRKQKQRHHK